MASYQCRQQEYNQRPPYDTAWVFVYKTRKDTKMYNSGTSQSTSNPGSGAGHTVNNGSQGASSKAQGINIGALRINPLIFYGGIALLVLVGALMLMRFLDTALIVHFGMAAGALLLVANVRELLGTQDAFTQQHRSTALMNSLIGGALLFAWLSQIVTTLFWVPAIVLIGTSVPLVMKRASLYAFYVQSFKQLVGSFKGAVRR